MNKVIIITKNHHLYDELSKLEIPFYTLNNPSDITVVDDHKDALLFDFTIFNTSDKEKLLTNIPNSFQIISDFSCSWGELLISKFSNIIGAMSTAFYSPKKTFEVFSTDKKVLDQVSEMFSLFGHEVKSVSNSGHGFIMPRTISMIINEAYFSLEDELASVNDIDTAMKFGVNYPLGPIEWSQKIGLTPVCLLLDDLYNSHHDKRYKLSTLLRLKEAK